MGNTAYWDREDPNEAWSAAGLVIARLLKAYDPKRHGHLFYAFGLCLQRELQRMTQRAPDRWRKLHQQDHVCKGSHGVFSLLDQIEARREAEVPEIPLDCLNEQERAIIDLWFYQGLTLGEVGAKLGFTGSYANQVKRKALAKLRRAMERDLGA